MVPIPRTPNSRSLKTNSFFCFLTPSNVPTGSIVPWTITCRRELSPSTPSPRAGKQAKMSRSLTPLWLEPTKVDREPTSSRTSGARAASSHTGSLAGQSVVFDAAMKQAGVFQVEDEEHMADLAMAFAEQPLPQGRNLTIVTNGGGPGIIATTSF